MFNDRQGLRKYFRAGAWITVPVALAIGVAACGPGNTTHASTTAAAVSPVARSAGIGVPESGAVATDAVAASTTAPPTTARHVPAPAVATPNKAATPPPAPANSPKPTSAPPPAVTAPVSTKPALPARRQPTAAEVNGVIASVHALFPLFTPTPAQIAKVGNDVCTAFDQGQTVAQVKAAAMQMAGAYAALIPATVADSAVRTIVSLFCPGYASKLG